MRFGRSTFGLAALISIVLTLGTLAIGRAAYWITHEAIERELDHRVDTETRALLVEPGADRGAAIGAAITRRLAAPIANDLDYLLVDRAGKRLAGNLDPETKLVPGYEEFFHARDGTVGQAMTSRLPDGTLLVVRADRASLSKIDGHLRALFDWSIGAMLLLGLGGAWTLGALTRMRLRRMDRIALAIIEGDLGQRMPVSGSGNEFDRLATTLNQMLDRIAALMLNLRQVSSDIAHDLRTPLTRLRHRLEEAAMRGDADRAAAIESAILQADEMLEIFSALLRISEIEGLGIRKHFRSIDLSMTLTDFAETFRPDAEQHGYPFEIDVQPGITVRGDRRLLIQLVSNLLDNALQHTPTGTRIRLSASRNEQEIRIAVSDDGPGVPAQTQARLFERFSRADTSRSSTGHGLGLALVAAIAAAHHGKASLATGPDFGIEVILPLP
jgi:signal transduction histidine kinase